MKNNNWKNINWPEVNQIVYDLQCKIFKANVNGSINIARTRYYQKTLVNSEAAKLVAIRKVTQDNREKKMRGVDGKLTLSDLERIELVRILRFDGSADSIRWVPKGSLNGLFGISTIKDRAKQTLLKLALEPEWEARFDSNSYGFRPGYSIADAKWMVTRQIQGSPKYFLRTGIKNCSKDISHEYLLKKLNTTRTFKNQIKSWLKAGILNSDFLTSTEYAENNIEHNEILSFLLVNIVLDGMEKLLKDKFNKNVCLIRYGHDFVVLSKKKEVVVESQNLLAEFLKPIKLEFSEKKTRSGHTLCGLSPGFDFLGFNFRNHCVSVHRGSKNTRGIKQNFLQISKPSRESVKEHKKQITVLLKKYKSAPLLSVIEALSKKIKVWTYYYSLSQSTKTFTMLDGWLWNKLWRWSVKRFKGAKNAKKQCFSISGWKFGFIDNFTNKKWVLDRYDKVKVRKHVKIKEKASIYSGQLDYFSKRLVLHHPPLKRLRGLFMKQGYKCAYCKTYFFPSDIIELHHVLDSNRVWLNKIQFVHGYCHDQIHSKSK